MVRSLPTILYVSRDNTRYVRIPVIYLLPAEAAMRSSESENLHPMNAMTHRFFCKEPDTKDNT